MSDEDPSDEELAEAQKEAQEILAMPVQAYDYRTEYKGGPRKIEPEVLELAAIEIVTARLLVEELEDRLKEAQILMYTKMQEHLDAGVPVDFVAEQSGLGHRSSVYRVMKRLPRLLKERSSVETIRQAFTRGTQ